MSSRKRRDPKEVFQKPDSVPVEFCEEEALPLLRSGELLGGRRIPWGSNYTFVVWVDAGEDKYLRAIYKPRDGERPLYDFPGGTLYKREYATFVLSRMLGWPPVPLTLVREGPYGIGSMQLYVECDPEITYFDLIEEKAEELQRLAVFDLLVNNADRKAGHCLIDREGCLWSIDHGLTFHAMTKLRTVMLEFWGKPIPEELMADLKRLRDQLAGRAGDDGKLVECLAPQEMEALDQRLGFMLEKCTLPALDSYHNVPWPLV